MKTTDIRKRLVDYMRTMSQIEWTPAVDMDFSGLRKGHRYYAGVTYRGLPYVNEMDCSLEEFQSYLKDGVYTGPTHYLTAIGVDCSSSVLAAWGHIASSVHYVWSLPMLPFQGGALPVGDYDIPPDNKTRTDIVVRSNGRQTMYEAYAKLLPGDALVMYQDSGHVRMVAADPVVIRHEDGTIDGLSYLKIIEITGLVPEKREGYETCWRVDAKFFFTELYDTAYLPLTCPELENGEMEAFRFEFTRQITPQGLHDNNGLFGTVSCNYRIYQVIASVLDERNICVRRAVDYPLNTVALEMISKHYGLSQLNEKLALRSLPAGQYRILLELFAADQTHQVLDVLFDAL